MAVGGLITMKATGLPDWLDRARPHDPTPVTRTTCQHAYHPDPYDSFEDAPLPGGHAYRRFYARYLPRMGEVPSRHGEAIQLAGLTAGTAGLLRWLAAVGFLPACPGGGPLTQSTDHTGGRASALISAYR
jgi:hypothetical protein